MCILAACSGSPPQCSTFSSSLNPVWLTLPQNFRYSSLTLIHLSIWCANCTGISLYHNFCLYIHAGSPNVTSLTFDGQSRTLTCTSTGGPATNVTWRRDGVVITLNATHQQSKRLVDSVNGTYQTVLTIDPSVDQIVGTYSCTVENVRGESLETVVVPGETWTLQPDIGTLQCLILWTGYIYMPNIYYFQWAWMTSSYACVTFKALPCKEAKPNDTLG